MVKAPYRVPIGRALLGALGAFPLRNFLKFGYSELPFGAVWGDLKPQICIFHLHNFIYCHFQ